ncbi:MAG: Cell surface protein, partial [Parcubacteria group bacterium GW2011_GWE2_39_37]
YPLLIPIVPGYDHFEAWYSGSSSPIVQTAYIPVGKTARSITPPFAVTAESAAKPNVVPDFARNTLVLLAPTPGDYAPVVEYSYQSNEGVWDHNYVLKPSLPLSIPLKTGSKRVVVSTGTKDANGVYKAGKETVWEYDSTGMTVTPSDPPTDPPSDPPTVNKPPVVNAGPDQTVILGATVQLNGNASDPNNDQLTYRWTFATPVGSQATLSNANDVTKSDSE